MAAGLMALAVPVAAQASTHPARPAITRVRPAPGISNVSSNGKLWYVYLSNGAVCDWEIGDHYMADGYASGEADIKCPYGEDYTEKVALDYAYTVGGTNYTATATPWTSWYGYSGTYWDLWTNGVCWEGSPKGFYWTTFAYISINGGTQYEGWSQTYKHYTIPACS